MHSSAGFAHARAWLCSCTLLNLCAMQRCCLPLTCLAYHVHVAAWHTAWHIYTLMCCCALRSFCPADVAPPEQAQAPQDSQGYELQPLIGHHGAARQPACHCLLLGYFEVDILSA